MRKLFILYLFLFCSIILPAQEESWTFSYLDPSLPSHYTPELIKLYPEFKSFLEQIRIKINNGEYDTVSQLLHNEINSYSIYTRHAYEFEKITTLIHIDAALDYFLRNEKKQGINKQYIAFYLLGRYDSEIVEIASSGLSLTNLKNSGYKNEPLFRFGKIVGYFPVFRFTLGQDLNNFYNFQFLLLRYKDHSYFNDLDFKEFYNSFTSDNYINKFNLIDFFSNVLFTNKERECEIARYYYEDDETSFFYDPSWDINDVLIKLSEDLLYMKDFIEDIRLIGNPLFIDGARKITSKINAQIPIVEVPITSSYNKGGTTNQIAIYVTLRKTRAEMFFNKYYKKDK